jgi:hypothetical protein
MFTQQQPRPAIRKIYYSDHPLPMLIKSKGLTPENLIGLNIEEIVAKLGLEELNTDDHRTLQRFGMQKWLTPKIKTFTLQ